MKFIHAGDVHLGNPFSGLNQKLPEKFKEQVQNSTILAFQQMVNYAVKEQVDFILLPGDFYNIADSGPRIQNIVFEAFKLLKQKGIQVYLSFGNHDFESDRQKHLTWPDNIHIFKQHVETKHLILDSGESVAISGFSYETKRQRQRVIDSFPKKAQDDLYHIGLYHGALGGVDDYYAPFRIDELLSKQYDYWALGHIHQREVLHEQPFIGYSGDLQGLNRKEIGAKGFYYVTATSQGLVPHFVETTQVLWDNLYLNRLESEDELEEAINALNPKQTLFLSIDVNDVVDNILRERIYNGITLEVMQKNSPDNIWIVGLNIKDNITNFPNMNVVDEIYWQTAQSNILDAFNVNQFLSDEVPIAIRAYFMSDEGKQELQHKMSQILITNEEEKRD